MICKPRNPYQGQECHMLSTLTPNNNGNRTRTAGQITQAVVKRVVGEGQKVVHILVAVFFINNLLWQQDHLSFSDAAIDCVLGIISIECRIRLSDFYLRKK